MDAAAPFTRAITLVTFVLAGNPRNFKCEASQSYAIFGTCGGAKLGDFSPRIHSRWYIVHVIPSHHPIRVEIILFVQNFHQLIALHLIRTVHPRESRAHERYVFQLSRSVFAFPRFKRSGFFPRRVPLRVRLLYGDEKYEQQQQRTSEDGGGETTAQSTAAAAALHPLLFFLRSEERSTSFFEREE